MMSQQPYFDSSSGAMAHNFFEQNKSGINFFFWACSSLTKQFAASYVAPAKKVRIRLRPIIDLTNGITISASSQDNMTILLKS